MNGHHHVVLGGGRVVYTPWFRHYRTGEKVYPKRAKAFRFWVRNTQR